MKRSEALRVIIKELDKNFEKSKTPCPTSLEFVGIAHDILYRLEEIKILPPKIYKDVNDFAMSYTDNPAELIEVYAKYEWDKE